MRNPKNWVLLVGSSRRNASFCFDRKRSVRLARVRFAQIRMGKVAPGWRRMDGKPLVWSG
jgi:hypothetical protein